MYYKYIGQHTIVCPARSTLGFVSIVHKRTLGAFPCVCNKKRSNQDFLYYENYIFHYIYVTNNILHTGLFSPSVISPLYTYKQFRFVLNLPMHCCAYREIIRDNWIHAILISSADEGENKTGANISMYTVFQFTFIYNFGIISLNWELYDNYVLSLYISTYIYHS